MLNTCLTEIFANDTFVHAVTQAESHYEKLASTLKIFHGHCQNAQALEEPWQLLAPVHEVYGRMHNITKCILTLLEPSPEMIGLSARDTLPLLDYKGSDALESSLQGALQEKKFWRLQVDDTNRVAASTKEQFPKLKKCLLDATEAKNGGCRPEVWLKVLSEALPLLPEMRKGLKSEGTFELEAILIEMIPATGKFITSSKNVEDLDTNQVTTFAHHLDLFDETILRNMGLEDHMSELSDLHQKMEVWQANMSRSIAAKELECFIDKCLKEAKDSATDKVDIDWKELTQLLMTSEGLSETLQPKMSEALFLMVWNLDTQATAAWHGGMLVRMRGT